MTMASLSVRMLVLNAWLGLLIMGSAKQSRLITRLMHHQLLLLTFPPSPPSLSLSLIQSTCQALPLLCICPINTYLSARYETKTWRQCCQDILAFQTCVAINLLFHSTLVKRNVNHILNLSVSVCLSVFISQDDCQQYNEHVCLSYQS